MNQTLALRRLAIPAIGLLIASAVLASMPAASAAPGDFPANFNIVSVSTPAPLEPDGLAGTIAVHYVYNYPNTFITASGVTAAATTLHFTPAPSCAGTGFLLTGATTIPIIISPPGPNSGTAAGKVEGDATFHIQATSDAPGETPVTCTFTAYVDAWGPNNDVPKTDPPSTGSTPVIATYHGLVGATVPVTIDEAGPQKTINYAIHLVNLGNARTFVNFNVVDLHSADGWNPVAPSQTSLESKNQGGTQTTADANFLISTPYKNGWNNKESTFQLKIQPQSTKNPQLIGNEITVNILARVRGIYVPGPDPMLMVGAILGTALLARLRKTA
ncbi:MAG: hypothetical protein V4510_11280 [bacterium]